MLEFTLGILGTDPQGRLQGADPLPPGQGARLAEVWVGGETLPRTSSSQNGIEMWLSGSKVIKQDPKALKWWHPKGLRICTNWVCIKYPSRTFPSIGTSETFNQSDFRRVSAVVRVGRVRCILRDCIPLVYTYLPPTLTPTRPTPGGAGQRQHDKTVFGEMG